jgi:hypothetical protein
MSAEQSWQANLGPNGEATQPKTALFTATKELETKMSRPSTFTLGLSVCNCAKNLRAAQ